MRKKSKSKPTIKSIILKSLPVEKPPIITDEQLERLKSAGEVALAIIGVAGTIALSAVAPNIFTALDKIFFKKTSARRSTRSQKEQKLQRTFYYLKEHGYIIIKPKGRDFKVWLSKLGKRKLKKVALDALSIPKPKSWNGKWWLVAADIPTEDYKWAADLFRQKLKDIKFYPLQRTLWFYPYDPRKEIEFLMNYFGIGRFVTVMEVERMDFSDEKKMIEFYKGEKILQ